MVKFSKPNIVKVNCMNKLCLNPILEYLPLKLEYADFLFKEAEQIMNQYEMNIRLGNSINIKRNRNSIKRAISKDFEY